MIVRKAYKYRLKAGPEQERLFRQQAGCCRFVWNKALALQKQRLDVGEKVMRYVETADLLTGWKRQEETAFLAEAGSQTFRSQARLVCKACGYEENADLVGAMNILAAGHAVSACGEMALAGRLTKQEPAEGLRHVA